MSSSAGVRTSFFVAMGHAPIMDWMITRPPPGKKSVDFLLFVVNRLLPRMASGDPERAWVDQPDRCVLILDNARVHDAASLTVERRACLCCCYPRTPPT